jgi:hypothetical protein
MTDEIRLALVLVLNLTAILLAGWLAGRYATRRVQRLLESERQRAEESRRRAQAEVMAALPPIPPEIEQLAEIERWVLTARDLQILLASLCTLIRINLGSDEKSRRGVSVELDRSLKYLGRLENKWLNASLPVVAYVRQLDPAKGKARDETLEAWLSRLNRLHVQAAQSLRRAASLCSSNNGELHGDSLIDAFLSEADRATTDLSGVIASALDRVSGLKGRLPERQAEQVVVAVESRVSLDPAIDLAMSASQAMR